METRKIDKRRYTFSLVGYIIFDVLILLTLLTMKPGSLGFICGVIAIILVFFLIVFYALVLWEVSRKHP